MLAGWLAQVVCRSTRLATRPPAGTLKGACLRQCPGSMPCAVAPCPTAAAALYTHTGQRQEADSDGCVCRVCARHAHERAVSARGCVLLRSGRREDNGGEGASRCSMCCPPSLASTRGKVRGCSSITQVYEELAAPGPGRITLCQHIKAGTPHTPDPHRTQRCTTRSPRPLVRDALGRSRHAPSLCSAGCPLPRPNPPVPSAHTQHNLAPCNPLEQLGRE